MTAYRHLKFVYSALPSAVHIFEIFNFNLALRVFVKSGRIVEDLHPMKVTPHLGLRRCPTAASPFPKTAQSRREMQWDNFRDYFFAFHHRTEEREREREREKGKEREKAPFPQSNLTLGPARPPGPPPWSLEGARRAAATPRSEFFGSTARGGEEGISKI